MIPPRRLIIYITGALLSGLIAYYAIFYPPPPRHIILITIDSLRADHLGCYGYKRNTSPEIDRFSKKAAVFTNAFTPRAETSAAVSSILTGLYPHRHGVRATGQKLPENIDTLPVFLRSKGYTTAAFVANFSLKKDCSALDRGFDLYDDRMNEKELNRDIYERTAPVITGDALKWAEANRGKNFFLWIHYNDPHHPYDAPEEFRKFFTHDRKDMIPLAKIAPHIRVPRIESENGLVDAQTYRDNYDAEILYCDKYVGALLGRLDELGVAKDALIIISADHGEGMGKHGVYFDHSPCGAYDDALRVPLIIHAPACAPAGPITEQVSHVDIMPTILSIARSPVPRGLEGQNLTPLLKGSGLFRKRPIFMERHNAIKGVRVPGWKYIMNFEKRRNKRELYNLRADPLERRNVIAVNTAVGGSLSRALSNWLNENDSGDIRKPNEPKVNEEDRKALRALGYLQ